MNGGRGKFGAGREAARRQGDLEEGEYEEEGGDVLGLWESCCGRLKVLQALDSAVGG